MSSESEYSLQMPFLDESESFCFGFECGQIWEEMKGNKQVDRMVHIENVRQVEMMCKRYLYTCEFTSLEDCQDWVKLNAVPSLGQQN